MSQMDEYMPMLYVISALLGLVLFLTVWLEGQYLLLLFFATSLVHTYIGGWAREVVKKRRTVSRSKVNLAISILFLVTIALVVGCSYAIYVGQLGFFPYLYLILMGLFCWTGGYTIYALWKRKLIPDKVYILVSLVLILLYCYFFFTAKF